MKTYVIDMVHTNTQPNPPVLENSENLTYWNNQPNYTPYSPSNSNEKQWFDSNWCNKCKSIQYKECSILIQMYAVGEQPKEIYFFENVPVCEKFTPLENG